MTILEILEEIKKGSPKAYKQMLGMLGDSSYFLKTLNEYMEKDPIGAKSFLTELANTIEDSETFHEQKEKKKWALSLASDLETLVDCLHGSKAGTTARTVKGIAIMVGANKGVWMFGMLTASSFGVAGTGTVIGTLSGAAFTSASLAWIGGSVASGTALLGAAGIALTLLIKSKGLSKSRKKADFSEEELEIDEAATGLAVALRTYFNNKSADTPLYRELVRRDGIAPIALRLDRVKSGHLGFFKKKRLHSAVNNLKNFAEQTIEGVKKYPNFTLGLFVPVFLSLMADDIPAKGTDEYLVIEALKRSNKSLESATDEEIAEYVSSLDEEQLDGLLNNVKGIYHEMLFVARENTDGDNVRAELFQSTNHAGADIILEDLETGETEEIQLKATDYINYVRSHQEKYPDIPIVATKEVSSGIDGVESSGFSNEEITKDAQEVLESLKILDNELFENSEGVAILIFSILHAKAIFKKDRSMVDNFKLGKEAATVAFAAYLSSALL